MELIRKTYAKNKFCENKHFGKEAFAVPLGLLSDGVLWHVPSAEYHRLRDVSVPPLVLQMLILSLIYQVWIICTPATPAQFCS